MNIPDEILEALSNFEASDREETIGWLEDKSTGQPDDDVILTILKNGSIACSELEDITHQIERYYGCFKDAYEFAVQLAEGLGNIPEWLEPYVDYQLLSDDLLNTDYIGHRSDDGKLYVFRK